MDTTYQDAVIEAVAEIGDEFERALDFKSLVDPVNWQNPGDYYRTMPVSTRAAVDKVVDSDEAMRRELRELYLPQLLKQGAVTCWQKADERYIEVIQQKKLYSGKVYSADGTIARYETLSLVGAQIAISKVSYQGTTGQIACNLMYMGREVPRKTTASDIAEAIRSRGRKLTNRIPNVFLYTLMLYKERESLLNSPPGSFKLIHGPVFPYEMLVGSGKQQTMKVCFDLLESIIDDGDFAAIVSDATQRELLVLGMALNAGEYIVVGNGQSDLDEFYNDENGGSAHYTRTPIPEYGGRSQIDIFNEFKTQYGPKVVRGVLRAHHMSPPFIFYCNIDRLDEAVHTLLADAANTGPRGFPLLVDMADQYCSGAFKASDYSSHMNAEFTRASRGSGIYQSERTTRD